MSFLSKIQFEQKQQEKVHRSEMGLKVKIEIIRKPQDITLERHQIANFEKQAFSS